MPLTNARSEIEGPEFRIGFHGLRGNYSEMRCTFTRLLGLQQD
jgi:hypothetical protein